MMVCTTNTKFVSSVVFVLLLCCIAPVRSEDNSYDVVVVGGGLSGLWTVHQLQKYTDLSVALLEARDRVGGRTLSRTVGDDSFDVGGQWTGRTQPHILAAADEVGVETFTQFRDGLKVLDINDKITHYNWSLPVMPLPDMLNLGLFFETVGVMLKQVPLEDAGAASKADEWDSETMSSFMDSWEWSASTLALIQGTMRVVFGKELDELSVLQVLHYTKCVGGLLPLVDDSKGGGQEWKFVGGSQSISLALARDADIRFNHTVVAVSQPEDGSATTVTALVPAASGEGDELALFKASRVVMALPPHLAVRVSHSPPLSAAKDHLLERLQPGHIIKVILTFSSPFWRAAGFSGEVVSDGAPVGLCYDDTSAAGAAALLCFVGGEGAYEWSPRPLEQRREAVLAQLGAYFGDEAIRGYNDYIEQDWGKEPLTGGCPAGTAGPGALSSRFGSTPMLREAHDRVHFGGTESATVWYGFMNGAIQSGQRTAMEVMAAMGLDVPPEMEDFYHMGESDLQ